MMELPKALPSEFYGDNPRWFIGLVIDARPPEGQGLEGYVRVRIHGVHSPSLQDVPESALPWAQVLIPTTEGGTSGLGSTPRIEAGSQVIGLFMDGQYSQVPVVLGSLPHTTHATPLQLGFDPIQPDIGGIDTNPAMNLDGVDNEETGDINAVTKERRQEESLKQFLDQGLSVMSAIAMVARQEVKSGMVTGEHADGTFGIDGFTGERLDQLKEFSEEYRNFDKQVEFISEELNTSRSQEKVEMGDTVSQNTKVLADNATEETAMKKQVYELSDKYGGG